MAQLSRRVGQSVLRSQKSLAVTSLNRRPTPQAESHGVLASTRNLRTLSAVTSSSTNRALIASKRNANTTSIEIETPHRRREGQSVPASSSSSEEKHQNEILPFDSIPGPKPLPLIGNKFLFTALGGYPFDRFWSTCWKLNREYGPIVRISKITAKMNIVFVFQPEDTKHIFQNEGPLPVRPPFDILEHYRKSRPQWFTSVGIVPGNGPEWRRLRTSVQVLLKRQIYSSYRQRQVAVAGDFVKLVMNTFSSSYDAQKQQHFVIDDILPLLFRYTLEAVGEVALGSRLGCLDTDGDSISRARSAIAANEDTLFAMGESIWKAPLHRIFPTRTFQRLAQSQDVLAKMVKAELVQQSLLQQADPEEFSRQQPFLDALMGQSNLSYSDLFLLLIEVFQGGIDATATTIAFCIYYLARNEEVQSKLYQEVKDIDLSTHDLQGLRYLRAVLQETFRLRPSASANSRILNKDVVFSGYHVPAGTLVSSPPIIASHDDKVFPRPSEFQPERWLSHHKSRRGTSAAPVETSASQCPETKKIHPYALLPFGHGARMCPGRRLAEQEIFILLIQIMKSFKMKQVRGSEAEVGQVMRLNMMPDRPISVRLIPR